MIKRIVIFVTCFSSFT